MNKLLFASISLLSASALSAATLYTDSFLIGGTPAAGEYSDGSDLNGQNPTLPNASSAWSGNSAADTVSGIGLSYSSGLINVVGSGGAVRQSNFNNDEVTRTTDLTDSQSDPGERWFAALVSMSAFDGSTDGIGVAFKNDSGSNSTVGMGLSNGEFQINGSTFGSGLYTLGTTALLVGKLEVVSTGNGTTEIWTVWANPGDSSSEAQLTATSLASDTQNTNVINGPWGALDVEVDLLGSGGSNNQIVDEIYVTDSLAELNDILAIPEPSSLLLLSLAAGLCLLVRRKS